MNRLSTGFVTSPTPTWAGTWQQSSAACSPILDDDTNEDTNKNLEEHQPSEEAHSTSLASDTLEPKSYKQALLSNEKDEWNKAIKAEIEKFYSRKVWKLHPWKNLDGRKPLGAKWVFKKKNEHDKQHYALQGPYCGKRLFAGTRCRLHRFICTRCYGYWPTYCVCNHPTQERFVCEIVDITAAFLKADLDEEIYIEWPDGIADFHYENKSTMTENCIRLDKAMYGTVQAAYQWFKKLWDCLLDMDSSKAVSTHVFYEKRQGILTILLCTYIDDLAVTGTQADVNKFKLALKQYFNIKELGQICKHLGVWYEWVEDENGRYLQSEMEDFVKEMINDYTTIFGKEPKKASTPGFPGTVLSKNRGASIKNKEYRKDTLLCKENIASMRQRMLWDELSQHLDNPGERHWQALERLLGYLFLHAGGDQRYVDSITNSSDCLFCKSSFIPLLILCWGGLVAPTNLDL